MRKVVKPLDFLGYLEEAFGAGGYARSDAQDEDMKAIGANSAACLYLDREYPEMIVAGYGADDAELAISSLCAVFPVKPFVVREKADDRRLALYAFRADSYFKYAPDAALGSVPSRGASSRPFVYLKKTAVKAIESYLSGDMSLTSSAAILTAADSRPDLPGAIGAIGAMVVEHPAEFIVARLFLPPRLTVGQYCFACVPVSVDSVLPDPAETRRFSFDAVWTFAGQSLSARYHIDLPAALGARAESLAKAAVSGMFKDALAFWGNWKKPIENPSIAARPDSATTALPRPESFLLHSEIRGEGMRFSCAVEFPQLMVGLFLKMANVAPLEGYAQNKSRWAIELFRANDFLFVMMKGGYRKAFLANPEGPIPFDGPTLFGLLSLMDDADKSVIIQNFLVPRYELANLPLFFFYREARESANGEAEYRLKPAFPLSRPDVERYLSGAQREEWRYHLAKGCPQCMSDPSTFAKVNREAVVELARAGASGKILLSRKAMDILREEVLAPIEAEDERALADDSSVAGAVDAIKALGPKALSELLMKVDNQTLAMAALSMPGLDATVMRGLSQARQGDVRTELEVMRLRRKRSELSAGSLLDARDRLISLANQYDDTLEDFSV